jgi:uncharacterized protein YhbP (UPF0306 family)
VTPEAFEAAVRGLLDGVSTLTLATCAEGLPWATDVYFAAEGYDLVFFSSPDSRHGRNLAANARCAGTVHPLASQWRDIRGLQIEGWAAPILDPEERARALAAYLAKFPFARPLLADPAATGGKAAGTLLYRLRPERVLYLDNSLGFGARFGVRLQEGVRAGPPEPWRGR